MRGYKPYFEIKYSTDNRGPFDVSIEITADDFRKKVINLDAIKQRLEERLPEGETAVTLISCSFYEHTSHYSEGMKRPIQSMKYYLKGFSLEDTLRLGKKTIEISGKMISNFHEYKRSQQRRQKFELSQQPPEPQDEQLTLDDMLAEM